MRLISHRGNIDGRNPQKENSPQYILIAAKEYDVEVDVWWDNGYWLGHDKPTYQTTKQFLKNPKFWCHAKNIQALYNLINDGIHCFFHNADEAVLTSMGYIWTYPCQELTEKSICVLPEKNWDYWNKRTFDPFGVCTDHLTKLIS